MPNITKKRITVNKHRFTVTLNPQTPTTKQLTTLNENLSDFAPTVKQAMLDNFSKTVFYQWSTNLTPLLNDQQQTQLTHEALYQTHIQFPYHCDIDHGLINVENLDQNQALIDLKTALRQIMQFFKLNA